MFILSAIYFVFRAKSVGPDRLINSLNAFHYNLSTRQCGCVFVYGATSTKIFKNILLISCAHNNKLHIRKLHV